jgi:hypothetical protein
MDRHPKKQVVVPTSTNKKQQEEGGTKQNNRSIPPTKSLSWIDPVKQPTVIHHHHPLSLERAKEKELVFHSFVSRG